MNAARSPNMFNNIDNNVTFTDGDGTRSVHSRAKGFETAKFNNR